LAGAVHLHSPNDERKHGVVQGDFLHSRSGAIGVSMGR
jgi:hypothetical protein